MKGVSISNILSTNYIAYLHVLETVMSMYVSSSTRIFPLLHVIQKQIHGSFMSRTSYITNINHSFIHKLQLNSA